MSKVTLNPKQMAFVAAYLNPKSLTYSKVGESLKAAGYSGSHSVIKSPWFQDIIKYGRVTPDEVIEGLKKETVGRQAKDRIRAWELLGKHLKLFTDRVETDSKVEVSVVNFKNVIDADSTSVRVQTESVPTAVLGSDGRGV